VRAGSYEEVAPPDSDFSRREGSGCYPNPIRDHGIESIESIANIVNIVNIVNTARRHENSENIPFSRERLGWEKVHS
jgi:hypothetical protein